MTLFGKILALLTAALGILMFTWALGIYTQRINWTATKGGELAKRTEQINKLKTALQGDRAKDDKEKQAAVQALAPFRRFVTNERPPAEENVGGAENRWRIAFGQLRFWEKYRDQNRPWYAQQLQSLETGAAPVKALVHEKGEIKRNPQTLLPELQDFRDAAGKEVLPREGVRNELTATQKELTDTLAKIAQLIKQEQQLTEQLAGETGAGGLRGQVDRELAKTATVKREQEDLLPQLLNTAVQAELLLSRQRRLAARVEELEKARSATARRE